jgi:hypothetical protein
VAIHAIYNVYTIFTIEQVKALSRENTQDFSAPLNMKYEDASYKWCKKCKQDVVINFIFVPTTTWMLYWQLPPEKHSGPYSTGASSTPVPYVFDVSLIPKKFVLHELFLNTHVEFELGYVSMQTTVKVNGILHHLSFQFSNDKFYFYDDMNDGKLVHVPKPDEIIKSKQLTISAIVYYRP